MSTDHADTSASLPVVRSCQQMYQAVLAAKQAGQRVGVVMTMGALHDGHLSLVAASNKACDFTVVTIFVNPTQFAPTEDLEKYPRDLESDLEKLSTFSVDAVFAPTVEEIYPDEQATSVHPNEIAKRLEGRSRPGHFAGVTTIVLKLLNIIPADIAFFGRKDYQQYLVIKKMVEDLNLSVEVRGCPTLREPDGLAMSSRNRYLSTAERQQALSISESLTMAEELASEGAQAGNIAAQVRRHLAAAGIREIDYVAIVDAETLEDVKTIAKPTLVAIAVRVGNTRLIDNRTIQSA